MTQGEGVSAKHKSLNFKEDFLDEAHIEQYRRWLNLNIEDITWQGKNRESFEEFWSTFFMPGLSCSQLNERFEITLDQLPKGPVYSWVSWLWERFICYIFCFSEGSIQEISLALKIDPNRIGNVLRDVFVSNHPHLESELSERFQIGNVLNPNLKVTYKEIQKLTNEENPFLPHEEDELMHSMEVTLYSEWNTMLKKIHKHFLSGGMNLLEIRRKASLKKQTRFFRDIFVYLCLGLSLIFIVKKGNQYYEKFLSNKVSIYEPQFKWLDKSLSFKPLESNIQRPTAPEFEEIEIAEEKQEKLKPLNEEEERFDTESDVVLTSWDSLPKDFDSANLEQSDYEEITKRGYRDTRYGHTKVFRVLMRSVDIPLAKGKLNSLIGKYKATQVDNVVPGKEVPGGAYYNIFVPRKFLKEFLAQVINIDEAVLYESRTRTSRNPPGKNKVFIWIKAL